MKINDQLKPQYTAVISDLEVERDAIHKELGALQKRIRELDNTLVTLRHRVDPGYAPPSKIVELRHRDPSFPENEKYTRIGVRWAILHLLGERGPLATADIADALVQRGVRTKAANFTNNVSAMLTATMRTKGSEEVESVASKWQLTENGRNKLAKIVASPDFLNACPWAEAPAVAAAGAAH
ncbi:MAG: hypothetical protein HYX27_14085 [Acidobacteria bacterium]|nr:hypothetical protein [Acidobacteriota bacterium]